MPFPRDCLPWMRHYARSYTASAAYRKCYLSCGSAPSGTRLAYTGLTTPTPSYYGAVPAKWD